MSFIKDGEHIVSVPELQDCIYKKKNEEAKFILQKMNNIGDIRIGNKEPLLHYSVRCKNAEMTLHLIKLGCDVNAKNNKGYTPLMLVDGDTACAEVLLKNNANIYETNSKKLNTLQFYSDSIFVKYPHSNNKNLPILEMILDKINKNLSTNYVKKYLFIQEGPVKLAILACGSIELIKLILGNGYIIDYCIPEIELTALHYAIIFAKFDNAKILIDRGANVNVRDKHGKSPLRYYTWNFESVDQNFEILLTLLKLSTISTMSNELDKLDLEELLREGKVETLRAVFKSGIAVNVTFNDGKSLMHVLVENQFIDTLDVIDELDFELDINKYDSSGWTPLKIAVCSGFIGKVEYLLKFGADVNLIIGGHSYLYWAVINHQRDKSVKFGFNYKEIIQQKVAILLLQNGADTQLVFDNGETIMDYLPRPLLINSMFEEVIIAHLALLADIDTSNVTNRTREMIQSNTLLKNYFDLYTLTIGVIKLFPPVYETVTLFELLSQKEDKIVAYARNQDLILAFDKTMEEWIYSKDYYYETLRIRVTNAKHKVEQIEKAVNVICLLTGLSNVLVVYLIINHLNYRAIHNLCRIDDIIK